MTNPDTHSHSRTQNQTLIVGISGPSSSGKTTLARLLQRIFCGVRGESGALKSFIIHEDDFYFPDDRIPYTTTPSGTQVQNWDSASAIDIPFLAQSLAYVRTHAHLPPRLQGKEDLNEVTDSGVSDDVVLALRGVVERRLGGASTLNSSESGKQVERTIAFLEGFLLYSPSETANGTGNAEGKSQSQSQSQAQAQTETQNAHDDQITELQAQDQEPSLRSVHAQIHLPLFLPASYQNVKARRERRAGYVTVGPAPTSSTTTNNEAADEKNKREEAEEIDLDKEDDRPPQNFWVDPPGYVDDVVWPRYVEDHAWLLVADEHDQGKGRSFVERVGNGTRVKEDVGVRVAPGRGEANMEELVRWAVDEVLSVL